MEEREKKHQFLKEEILDKNYSTEAFIEFCEQDRGADIDLWSLDDLKLCVKSFQSQLIKKQYSSIDLLDCLSLKPTILNSDSVKVLFSKPEPTSSQSSSKEISFTLFTLPMSWKVTRKFSDFKWLHENLSNEYPGYYVPVFNENDKASSNDSLHITILMKQLTLFLNYVVSSDLFKRSVSLLNFLQEESPDKFKKNLKQKSKKITEAKNMGTFDGKISCEYQDNQDFTSQTTVFFDCFHDSLKRLEAETKNLQRLQMEQTNSISNFSIIMAEIGKLSKIMPANSKAMKEFFEKVSESFRKVSESVHEIRVNINENVHGTIKFVKNQGSFMKGIFKEKDLAFAEVESIKQQISKIIAKDKPVKKELTDKSRLIQEKAGVFNYCCQDQTERLFAYASRLLFDDFDSFLKGSIYSIKEVLGILSTLKGGLEESKNYL